MKYEIIPPIGSTIEIERAKVRSVSNMTCLHRHDFHEIYFLLSGERRFLLGHSIYDVSPGDLVIVPKNEFHRTTAIDTNGYDRYVIYFYDDSIKELADNIIGFEPDRFFQLGCLEFDPDISELIRGYLTEMTHEQNTGDEYSTAYMQNILRNIIITILRFGRQKNREQNEDADKIQSVARYIREHYRESISLATASRMAYMENTYFSKRFKALTGFGFNEYLTETRMQAAEKLLRLTSLSISEISERCGYSSSNYFGDAFRQYKGTSPSEFRKSIKNSEES